MLGVGKLYWFLAPVLAILTVFWIFFAARFSWSERADFDILGIAWLFLNFPGLFAVAMAVFFAALTVYAAFQVVRYTA